MTRDDFLELAGGVFQSSIKYDHWSSADKDEFFWSFFDVSIGPQFSFYSGLQVGQLVNSSSATIEHIVPRQWLNDKLRGRDKRVRYGATVNPFNFAPSHKKLNSARSAYPFDFDDDPVEKKIRLNIPGVKDWETGLDRDGQWVLPLHSRGSAARAIIYMGLTYQLKLVDSYEVPSLLQWLRQDVASFEEIRFNHWVKRRLGICNPLLDRETLCQSFKWLDESALLETIVRGESSTQ